MAEEPTSQQAFLPAPVETRPELSESTSTTEKVESIVENSAVADPIEPLKEVAAAPTIGVGLEQPVASVPAEPEPVAEKRMSKFPLPV